MYFRDIYKPIPTTYNLVMAMLWRHPEHVDLDKINVVHYCAKVCVDFFEFFTFLNFVQLKFILINFTRVQNLGDSLELKSIWIEKTLKCW